MQMLLFQLVVRDVRFGLPRSHRPPRDPRPGTDQRHCYPDERQYLDRRYRRHSVFHPLQEELWGVWVQLTKMTGPALRRAPRPRP